MVQPALPLFQSGNFLDLHLESQLRELPLYSFSVEISCLVCQVAQVFEQHPLLPGVVLVEAGEFCGMLSRQRFLDYLMRPQGLEFFWEKPLRILYSYARAEIMVLAEQTSILAGVGLALRRSRELLCEPILVESDSAGYRLLDFQELNKAAWQIRGIETQVRYEKMQLQMLQSEKMASLGRLVNGVAHEILDPVGFIWGNLSHVCEYQKSLLALIAAYESAYPHPPSAIEELREEIEFDYLRDDFPQAIQSITAGANRLKKLVTALQNFCHIDEVYPKPADINSCLDGIVLLLKSRIQSEIEIIQNYSELPPVTCYIGQLHQVFMNILFNALTVLINAAIAQEYGASLKNSSASPRIQITTQVIANPESERRWISISIADNGMGISPEMKQKILESFSIEKRTEKETSLALSYQIITANHGGKLTLRSRHESEGYSPAETGTEFEILLPLI